MAAFLEAEIAEWADLEPDDYDDHVAGDDYTYDDIDSDILESLVILALTGVLAFLLYYRTQRQRRAEEERRRQAGLQPQPQPGQGQGQVQPQAQAQAQAAQQQGQPNGQRQEDRGMFPAPDDPEYLNWAAGAVGH